MIKIEGDVALIGLIASLMRPVIELRLKMIIDFRRK